MKKVSEIINDIFLQLNSQKAVQISISTRTDKALISIISMDEAKKGVSLIEPKGKKNENKSN